MLDEVDKVLEKCGHCFARDPDDCNVYVRSRKAGGGRASDGAVAAVLRQATTQGQ